MDYNTRELLFELLLANAQRRKVKVFYQGDPQKDLRIALFLTLSSRPGVMHPLGQVDFRFFRQLQQGNLSLVRVPEPADNVELSEAATQLENP